MNMSWSQLFSPKSIRFQILGVTIAGSWKRFVKPSEALSCNSPHRAGVRTVMVPQKKIAGSSPKKLDGRVKPQGETRALVNGRHEAGRTGEAPAFASGPRPSGCVGVSTCGRSACGHFAMKEGL